MPPGSVAGDIQTALGTVEERELREAIRLQELERFALSLRAPAVVGDPDAATVRRGSAASAEPVITGDPLVDEQLLALMRQEAAGGAAGQVPSRAPQAPPPAERTGAPEVVPVRPAAPVRA